MLYVRPCCRKHTRNDIKAKKNSTKSVFLRKRFLLFPRFFQNRPAHPYTTASLKFSWKFFKFAKHRSLGNLMWWQIFILNKDKFDQHFPSATMQFLVHYQNLQKSANEPYILYKVWVLRTALYCTSTISDSHFLRKLICDMPFKYPELIF